MSSAPSMFTRSASAVLIAASLSTLTVGVATAEPQRDRPTLSQSERIQQGENFVKAIEHLRTMPKTLQDKPMSSPEVQRWMRSNMTSGGIVTPQTNWITCGAAIIEFGVKTGIPVSKLLKLIDEAGGAYKVGKYVYEFVRKGTWPAEATDETIEFLVALTGVPDVMKACL